MPILPSGLQTANYGTQGWNAIYSTNFELLDTRLKEMILAAQAAGAQTQADNADTVTDPAALTSATMTNSSGGSVSTTVGAVSGSGDDTNINNNFASLADQMIKLRADVAEIRSKAILTNAAWSGLKTSFNALLAKLRKTTGTGVLGG